MMNYKLFKNKDGVIRVQVEGGILPRWLTDEDFMIAMASSHKPTILNFYSEKEAYAAIVKAEETKSMARSIFVKEEKKEIVVDDSFLEIK